MTRNPSIDYVAAHRRYVFEEPPISLTDLAAEIGCARAALAAKAAGEEGEMSWYEQREEFRRRLGEKTLAALADKWAAYEAANREKRMETANAVLDNFVAQLTPGMDEDGKPIPSKIKIGSREALEWVGLMRQEFDDVRRVRAAKIIDGEVTDDLSIEDARRALEEVKRLTSGDDA
jgi:hypothetical protein